MKNLLTAIERSSRKRFGLRHRFQLGLEPALQVLEHHGHQAHIGDFVADEGVAHELRPQRAQMHHARAADERPDKADHEIDGVIRGQNTQVAHARPEGIQRDQRLALLQIIFMGEHASLGTPAGPGRIDDAGHVLRCARHKYRLTFAAKFLPAKRAREVRSRRRFRHQNGLHVYSLNSGDCMIARHK